MSQAWYSIVVELGWLHHNTVHICLFGFCCCYFVCQELLEGVRMLRVLQLWEKVVTALSLMTSHVQETDHFPRNPVIRVFIKRNNAVTAISPLTEIVPMYSMCNNERYRKLIHDEMACFVFLTTETPHKNGKQSCAVPSKNISISFTANRFCNKDITKEVISILFDIKTLARRKYLFPVKNHLRAAYCRYTSNCRSLVQVGLVVKGLDAEQSKA